MDSKFGKWNELPPHLQLECVKRMNFESRMRLRQASKSEMALVESAPKVHLESVEINLEVSCHRRLFSWTELESGTLKIEEQTSVTTASEFTQTASHLFVQLQKFADIDHLLINDLSFTLYMLEVAAEGPFRTKKLTLRHCYTEVFDHFLKNCEGVDEIFIESFFDFDVTCYPSLLNAKLFSLSAIGPDTLVMMIEKWIENDVKIGNVMRYPTRTNYFLEITPDRVVKGIEHRVIFLGGFETRLRTDNDAKHIFISKSASKPVDSLRFYTITMIPASSTMGMFEKWNQLPPEMRYECVKLLDFKSRMQLRGASKADKWLVESTKHSFEHVYIQLQFDAKIDNLRIFCYKERKCNSPCLTNEHKTRRVTPEFLQKALLLVVQFLKFAVINSFHLTWFGRENEVPKLLNLLSDVGPMRFESLSLKTEHTKLSEFFLKNCVGVKSIGLMGMFEEDLTSFQLVIDAKTVGVSIKNKSDMPRRMIEKWIENDVEIGKVLRTWFRHQESLEDWCSEFPNRVLYSSDTKIRLRTDNPAKHILIRSEFLKPDIMAVMSVGERPTVIATVIPSDGY